MSGVSNKKSIMMSEYLGYGVVAITEVLQLIMR